MSHAAARARSAHLDRIKVGLVAGVIVVHAGLGYSGLRGAWPYAGVAEVRLSPAAEVVLGLVALPGAMFALGLFFLISGLLAPGSLDRRGPAGFARERLLRLGVPLAIWTVVIWPASVALTRSAAGLPGSWRRELLASSPPLDTGPMWFLAVLLVYSLGYAAWRALAARRRAPTLRDGLARDRAPGRAVRVRTVLALALAVSVATVAVRQVFPFASGQVGQAHLWQWPQYAALFGLGLLATRSGALDPVPAPVRRAAGLAGLGALAAFAALVAAVLVTGTDRFVFFAPGWHWAPLALATLEGPLAVGVSIWLLAVAQERLARPPRRWSAGVARSAFGAYALQGPLLLAFAVALRPVEAGAEVKLALVAAAGIAASFALAAVLVHRTPAGRIL